MTVGKRKGEGERKEPAWREKKAKERRKKRYHVRVVRLKSRKIRFHKKN